MSENEVVITTEKKKKKRGGAALIIGGVALTAAIGGVFAYTGTIEINGSNGIELGGGVSDVASCTASATTSISQTFTGTDFLVSEVTVTGLNASCSGKVLEVRLGSTGANGAASCDLIATSLNAGSGPVGTDAYFNLSASSSDTYVASPTGDACISGSVGQVILTTSDAS